VFRFGPRQIMVTLLPCYDCQTHYHHVHHDIRLPHYTVHTCPFMSPHTNRLSFVDVSLKTFPNTPLNSSFSSVDLPTCGAYTETMFKTLLPTVTLSILILSLMLTNA